MAQELGDRIRELPLAESARGAQEEIEEKTRNGQERHEENGRELREDGVRAREDVPRCIEEEEDEERGGDAEANLERTDQGILPEEREKRVRGRKEER